MFNFIPVFIACVFTHMFTFQGPSREELRREEEEIETLTKKLKTHETDLFTKLKQVSISTFSLKDFVFISV